MKAVRFHESANQGTGRNKISSQARLIRRSAKREKMELQEIVREMEKAAGVYETFKNKNQHEKITALCNEDEFAYGCMKQALHCILGHSPTTLVDGLSQLESAPRPIFRDLNPSARKWLATIAHEYPDLVPKSSSTISTTSTTTIVATTNVVIVKVSDVIPAAFHVVLGAAYKLAKESGVSDFAGECGKIFLTDSEDYRAAYSGVVEGGEHRQEGAIPELAWDFIEKAIGFVEGIDVRGQARLDTSTTEHTDTEHLSAAAITALSGFIRSELCFKKVQIGELAKEIFAVQKNWQH
ncbi:hypothetical protein IV203_033143 [Nitzschia inconspicua]|uniref:Uncharacterized protein n=1 Tax=Nitzschia inconspicua TaxID=303405 RepID=A0A9K3PFG5_9STRA|nr:hypothetical protein IV203_033143 [Nitzschia inconspicua]